MVQDVVIEGAADGRVTVRCVVCFGFERTVAAAEAERVTADHEASEAHLQALEFEALLERVRAERGH
jgi:hypothetical protein